VMDRYPRSRLVGARFVLVEAQDRVMLEIPSHLAEFASRELRNRGIEIRTNTMLDSIDERSATLSTGERIPARTVCWTAGVKPPAVVGRLGLPLVRGRIDVDATMRVKGHDNVWAIGDAAAVPDPAKRRREPAPPTAQHAIRQGRRAAENVAAALAGGKTKPFRYRTLGVFVDMGQHQAVAQMLGIPLRGFPAWFAARTYHLMMMPGVARRVRLAADWTTGLFFGRASAELGQLGHPALLGDEQQTDELAPR
jgi:NADH:ubiquinone reductase (H+-translocating)